MSNGKRRYFPGANTGRGFIGHFEGIVPPWSEPHYTYVLKGGPGVGKSTLMKKCAAIARANGFTVEEFRCASDPESFDAVRIPQRRLVLLDGTAPHTIDPAMPERSSPMTLSCASCGDPLRAAATRSCVSMWRTSAGKSKRIRPNRNTYSPRSVSATA